MSAGGTDADLRARIGANDDAVPRPAADPVVPRSYTLRGFGRVGTACSGQPPEA
jgi:hypothetical protein